MVGSTTVGDFVPAHGKFKVGMKYHSFSIGDIIWAPWVVSGLDPKAVKLDNPQSFKNFTWVESAGPVTGKMKPMIISGIYKDHLVCYPIHTSGGNGLSYKDPYKKSLCLPVFDAYHDAPAELGMNYLRSDRINGKQGAYVDLTHSYNVELQYPICQSGRMSDTSVTRMQSFVETYTSQGREAVNARGPHRHPVLEELDGVPLRSPALGGEWR